MVMPTPRASTFSILRFYKNDLFPSLGPCNVLVRLDGGAGRSVLFPL